nr:AbfB domain-containing protein [uncultured Actinoplanes sp.]
MSDDDNREGLRIGPWVPPYRDAATGESRARDRKAPRPARIPPWTRPDRLETAPETDPIRRMRLVLAAAAGVVAAVVVTFALVGLDEPAPPTTAGSLLVPPPAPIPSAAVSILPAPSASSSPTPSAARTSRKPARRPSPSRTISRTTSRPATPDGVLADGSTVGIVLAGYPDARIRVSDSLARIDRIGPGSSASEKASARFRVRKGLGSSSCFSFASVSSPQLFLRHRDFVLRLEARDGGRLFDEDATFCAVPARGGVVLRSLNYPDHFLAVRRGGIRIDDDRATAFAVRPPL